MTMAMTMLRRDIQRKGRTRADIVVQDAIATVSQCGGLSMRKALVVVVGSEAGDSAGRMMDIAALRKATVDDGMEPTAMAGNSTETVSMNDVIDGYATARELPVVFIDDIEGKEVLTMFLYEL